MEANLATTPAASSPSPGPCRWYQFGLCWRGDSCTSSHSSSTPAEPVASTSTLPPQSATPPPADEDEGLSCAICFEVPEMWGLLDSCSHPFCITCIRAWRTHKERTPLEITAGKTCPTCRRATGLVTPSFTFWKEGTEKDEAMRAHKEKLAATPCRHLLASPSARRWCPFGSDCLYAHILPTGERYTFAHTHADTLATEARLEGEARIRDQMLEALRETAGMDPRRVQQLYEAMSGMPAGAPWEEEEEEEEREDDWSDDEEEESEEDWEDEDADEDEADDEDDDPPEAELEPRRPFAWETPVSPPPAPTANRLPQDPAARPPVADNPLRRPRHLPTLGAARRERERLAAEADEMPVMEDIDERPVVATAPAAAMRNARGESDDQMPGLVGIDEPEVRGRGVGLAWEPESRDGMPPLESETDEEEEEEEEEDSDDDDDEDEDESEDESDEDDDDDYDSEASRREYAIFDQAQTLAAGLDEGPPGLVDDSDPDEMPALVEVTVAAPVSAVVKEEEEESEGETAAVGPSAEMREERARAADRRAVEARSEDVD